MQLTTPVHINPFSFKLGYQNSTLIIGSCFATNIGERLNRLKLPVLVNPFGVVYNPVSIVNSIELLLGNQKFSYDDLFFSNGLWSSFYHHSSFSSSDKDEVFQNIQKELEKGKIFLKHTDRMIITLGTARVYEYKRTGQIVSNCHKVSASEFTHRLLSIDEVYAYLSKALLLLKELRPDLKIILTVSPIRHIKDGAHGNQLSKSTLLLAAERLCKDIESTAYFPAYEIMMDELRDYRYYADDMLHPSSLAVEYIWQKFSTSLFNDETQQLIGEMEKVVKAKDHRPFNIDGEEYKAFKKSFLSKVLTLKECYPFLNLEDDIRFFSNIN